MKASAAEALDGRRQEWACKRRWKGDYLSVVSVSLTIVIFALTITIHTMYTSKIDLAEFFKYYAYEMFHHLHSKALKTSFVV